MDGSDSYLHAVSDPDQLHAAISGTTMKIKRLSSAQAPSQLGQFVGHNWALDVANLQVKVEAEGPLPPGCDALLFVRGGNESRVCGIPLDTGTVVVIPNGTSISASMMPGVKYSGLLVPTSSWLSEQAAESGLRPKPDHAIKLSLGVDAVRDLAACFNQVAAATHPQSGLDAASRADDYVARAVSMIAEHAETLMAVRPPRDNAVRVVKVAHDYIHANVARQINIVSLCAAVGVSRRQLEYAFRAQLDLSPHQYIALTQLNEIRRALLKGRTNASSVTDTAFAYGVRHLSRFSQSYRVLFGELPSETLRRRDRPL